MILFTIFSFCWKISNTLIYIGVYVKSEGVCFVKPHNIFFISEMLIIGWSITLYMSHRNRNFFFLFVRALETGRKVGLLRTFLFRFTTSANDLYLFRQCSDIMFILQCQNAQNNCQIV